MSGSSLSPAVRSLGLVVVLGAIMSVLDTTIVNVALDTLARDLDAPLEDVQWVATGYLLALAAVIPITGWMATAYGPRRVYLAALVAFTAGSALCAAAWNVESLVAFRVLQGIGGGMTLPIGQMMLARAAGPQNMGRVMSLIGVPIVLAPVLGPVLGGWLLDSFGWQWIFLINVPIGVLAVALGLKRLPHAAPDRETAGPLDVRGLVLLAVGLPLFVYGLAELGTVGTLADTKVWGPLLLGAVLIATFVLHALRADRPLLDVRLFQNRAFSAAAVTTFCLGGALFGAMLIVPLYYQLVRGEDALTTGLLLAPQGIGAALAMFLSGRFTDRVGGGPVAVAGIAILALSTVPLALIGPDDSYVLLSALLVLRGFGVGTSIMPAMSAAYAVLTPAEITNATPQLTVLQRVGGSVGTAILSVVLSGQLEGARTTAQAADAFGTTYWWALVVSLVAVIPALVLVRVERKARAGRTVAEVRQERDELALERVEVAA
ncbi:MAG: family efflux transporter permease subunit [Solirubrobacterales bacterium]|jgi:EmrB/QacA subfamily drug resistance transporter|nr:family efflux transporter permease subunit [Solirubrobacterales bacterium]